MGEKAAKFVIERASVLNFWYKVFQTVAATLILAGFYAVWSKSEEIIQTPKQVKEIQKILKDHAKRIGGHDTLLIQMNGKLDLILLKQTKDKEKEIEDLLEDFLKDHAK